MSFRIKGDYCPGIMNGVFVSMDKLCVSCEVGTELLDIN